MPIPCPAPAWPKEFLEVGPEADPTILLTAPAEIAGAPYKLVAMRVDPHRLKPDVSPELEEEIYGDYLLDEMLEELGFVQGDIGQSAVVHLVPGWYLMWMVPAGTG
jgi:hypothetical protein